MARHQSLVARAHQIIDTTEGDITSEEAMKRAIAERYKDDLEGLLNLTAQSMVAYMGGASSIAKNIPDPDQLTLDGVIPAHFPTSESGGTLWRDRRNPETKGKHAKRFARDVERFGKQIARRGARLVELLAPLDDEAPLEPQLIERSQPAEVTA